MSISYEIYKKSVGGKTMTGEDMKNIDELPQIVQTAWKNIDEHFTKKKVVENSKAYDEFKQNRKEIKEFDELPSGVKKIWGNVDKNYEKLLKLSELKPVIEKKEKKTQETPIKKKEEKVKESKGIITSKQKKTSISEKLEALKKLKGQ